MFFLAEAMFGTWRLFEERLEGARPAREAWQANPISGAMSRQHMELSPYLL
jgi:hypothetical protein